VSELAAHARTELGWSDNEESRAFERFRHRYPDCAGTARLDELRQREYARLDAEGQTYLDFTGGGLYAESQLESHMAVLRENVYGNPHSVNPASLAATELVQRARAAVRTRALPVPRRRTCRA
jgi:selenocysteine lyase/cysteine desulfurase